MSLVWHNAQIKWKLFKQAFIKKFWFLCVQNTPFFTHRSEKKQQLNNFLIKTYKQVMLSLIYGASIEEELKLNGKKKEIIRTWFLLGSFKTRSFLNYGILFFFFFLFSLPQRKLFTWNTKPRTFPTVQYMYDLFYFY